MSVTFVNEGLIDMQGVTTFGACVKESKDPIGYFGTGLKFAIAVLLREGCEVELQRGDEHYTFHVKETPFRDSTVNMVHINGEPLPFTTELGKNWEPWMAYRELACNAFDEGGGVTDIEPEATENQTQFIVEGAAIEDAYLERKTIFLDTIPKYRLKGLHIHDDIDSGRWLYGNGIRVMKLNKPALYNYNLVGKLRLTEDRTLTSLSQAYMVIAKALVKSEEVGLLKQILMATNRFFESTIDYHWWSVNPGEAFNTVVQRMISSGTSFSSSAKALHRRDHPKDDPPAIIQMELISIDQRRKLWAAQVFWGKLGFEIPRGLIHVTTELGQKKGKVIAGHIYISKFVLEMEMKYITGLLFKFYSQSKPTISGVTQEDLFIDTIVDFGERVLGVQQRKAG